MTEVQTSSATVDSIVTAVKAATVEAAHVMVIDNMAAGMPESQSKLCNVVSGEPRGIKRKRTTESDDENDENDESSKEHESEERRHDEQVEEQIESKDEIESGKEDESEQDEEQKRTDQDNEEQEEQNEEQESERDEEQEVKEPAKKKQRLSEQEEQEKRARKAKQQLIADSGKIYHVKDEDLSSESKQKVDKGFSLEQKLGHKKSKLQKLSEKTKNIRAELTHVFAKVVGGKKFRNAMNAAIALGNALAANEDAQMEAKVRGKLKASSSDLVPKSELQKIKTDCIIAKCVASNGWEYTYRMKPGKLPPANKKFVREAAVRLICEKKFLSQQHQVPKQVEYFIDVLYSQSFRSKFRKEPESVIDCKLPKPPKEKKNKKTKEGEASQDDAIDEDASKDEEAESD
jgi:hypothetical protein